MLLCTELLRFIQHVRSLLHCALQLFCHDCNLRQLVWFDSMPNAPVVFLFVIPLSPLLRFLFCANQASNILCEQRLVEQNASILENARHRTSPDFNAKGNRFFVAPSYAYSRVSQQKVQINYFGNFGYFTLKQPLNTKVLCQRGKQAVLIFPACEILSLFFVIEFTLIFYSY